MTVRMGCGWPTGATPPIAKPVCSRTNVGVGLLDVREAGEVGDLVDVDPVRPGGEDEEGLHVALVRRRDEDEAVGDLGGGDAEGLGGRLRGAHGVGEVAHLGGDVVQREGVEHGLHAGVAGEVAQRHRVARLGVMRSA